MVFGFRLFLSNRKGVKYMKLNFFELKSEADLGPLQHLVWSSIWYKLTVESRQLLSCLLDVVAAFLEFESVIKNHLKTRKHIWEIPQKLIYVSDCVNFAVNFKEHLFQTCSRQSETNKRTAVAVFITYLQFSKL